MVEENERIQRAKELMRQIQIKTSQAITPAQLGSLLALKGLTEVEVCERALLDPATLRGWMTGKIPILPSKTSDLIGLIVGFEKGRFTPDRAHVFDLNEKRMSKDQISVHLQNFLPALRGSAKSAVFSEQSNDIWFAGSRIDVVGLSDGAHLVVAQTGRSRFGATSVLSCLGSIGWAAHASSADGARSELVVGESLRARLASSALMENDSACNALLKTFLAAKQDKENQNFRPVSSSAKSAARRI